MFIISIAWEAAFVMADSSVSAEDKDGLSDYSTNFLKMLAMSIAPPVLVKVGRSPAWSEQAHASIVGTPS